jgi:hypothetical protein
MAAASAGSVLIILKSKASGLRVDRKLRLLILPAWSALRHHREG